MANPFFVQPTQYGPALQGLAETVQQFGQQRADEKRRAEAVAYEQEARSALMEAVNSGDPARMRNVAIQYPEVSETMQQVYQFTNDRTREAAIQGYSSAAADPANAANILEQTAQRITELGGTPRNTLMDVEMLRRDPEAGMQRIKMGLAGVAPDVYDRVYGGGTADPAAVRAFEARARAAGLEPGSEEYQRAAQIELGLVPRAGISAEERIATQRDVGEAVAQQAGREAGATEQARQDVRSRSPEAVRKQREEAKASRMNIASTEDIVRQTDDILTNEDFIDSITGARGRLPAVPGTSGFDAEVALDRLKNSLTLGNLDKMSGVLSESDIKILASEAGGLEPGMSREAMISRLQQIRQVFQSKTEEERRKLSEMMSDSQGEGQQESTEVNWSDL